MWAFTFLNLIWAVLVLAFSWILCPIYGGMGLAWAYFVAHFIHTIVKMLYVNYKLVLGAIEKEWKMIAFSTLILLFCMVIWHFEKYIISTHIIFFIISLAPIAIYLKHLVTLIPEEVV